jgi:hypothetical protein
MKVPLLNQTYIYSHLIDNTSSYLTFYWWVRSILDIIDTYKAPSLPYLILHSNKEEHRRFGGEGQFPYVSAPTIHWPILPVPSNMAFDNLLLHYVVLYRSGRKVS